MHYRSHLFSSNIIFIVKQTKNKAFDDNLQILFVFFFLSIINVLGLALLLLLEMHYESLLWGRFRQYFYYQQNIQHDKTNEIMINILLMPLVKLANKIPEIPTVYTKWKSTMFNIKRNSRRKVTRLKTDVFVPRADRRHMELCDGLIQRTCYIF